MKLKYILSICFILQNIFNIIAQNYSISGIVYNDNKEIISYANIVILDKENNIIYGTITGENGKFIINSLEPDKYIIQISFIGYSTYIENINLNENIQLHIFLKEDVINLQTVEIAGYKKLIKNEKGKTILTLENSVLSLIPSMSTILSLVPGVIVQEESIEVIGKGVPLIYIDGREVKNQSQILYLQPERIKSITVERNPSSKYDSKYKSVIHIETIKSEGKELSTQLIHASTGGNMYRHSETININHSTGKWTNFSSYKYKNLPLVEESEIFQNLWDGSDSQQINNYKANRNKNQDLQNFIYGSNLKINNSHIFDFQYIFNNNNANMHTDGYEIFKGNNNSKIDVKRIGKEINRIHTLAFNYRWQIDTVSQLNIFIDYAHINNINNESVENDYKNNNTENYKLLNHSLFNSYIFKTEYESVLFDYLSLNSGIRITDIKGNGISDINRQGFMPDLNENSLLKETTYSAYSVIECQFEGFSFETGLRIERNKSNYIKKNQIVLKRPYTSLNFFPSSAIYIEVSNNFKLNLEYQTNISRPNFSDLDPSINYISSILYEQGNPNLKPEISQNIELTSILWDRLSLSTGYTVDTNPIAYLIEVDDINTNLLYNRPINLTKSTSISFNTSYNIRKGKLNTNITGNAAIQFPKYMYLEDLKEKNLPYIQFVTSNFYMITERTTLFGNFLTQSRYTYLNNEISPTYNIVLGANFTLFNDKITLTVFCNDLLNKSEPDNYSKWEHIYTGQKIKADSRELGVIIKLNINNFDNKFKQINKNNDILKRINKN